MSSLDDLRRRINELDRQILELVGKRQETSLEVARAKRATGQATRDYNRGVKEHMEKHDIEREARDAAPRSEEEARQMEEAERAGKDKARGGGA